MQVILLLDDFGDAHVLVGHLRGHHQLHFNPVHGLRQAQTLHVLRVIGIIVDGGHGAELVEALGEHAFGVHVGEAQRPLHLRHPALAAPGCHGVDEGAAHVLVVHEVYPPEAHRLLLPRGVGAAVDDGRHAAHEPPLLVSQEVVGLAKLERRVLIARKRLQHVLVQVGHGEGVVLIHLVIQADKPFQLPPRCHLLNFYGHCRS